MTNIVLDIDNLVVGLGKTSQDPRIIDGVSLQVRERETLRDATIRGSHRRKCYRARLQSAIRGEEGDGQIGNVDEERTTYSF